HYLSGRNFAERQFVGRNAREDAEEQGDQSGGENSRCRQVRHHSTATWRRHSCPDSAGTLAGAFREANDPRRAPAKVRALQTRVSAPPLLRTYISAQTGSAGYPIASRSQPRTCCCPKSLRAHQTEGC